jgi:hypothetical protein
MIFNSNVVLWLLPPSFSLVTIALLDILEPCEGLLLHGALHETSDENEHEDTAALANPTRACRNLGRNQRRRY